MAEVIGILGVVAIAKDAVDIIISIKEAFNDFCNTDKHINNIINELSTTENIINMFKHHMEKDDDFDKNIEKDVTETLVYIKQLLEDYKNKLVEMKFNTRSAYALFGGKGKIKDIREEILRVTCKISYYALLLTLDNTEILKKQLNKMYDLNEDIKNNVTLLDNNVKKQFELVLSSRIIVHYRESKDTTELIELLQQNDAYYDNKNIHDEKIFDSIHTAIQDSHRVIVHTLPDVKNLINTLSVTKFIQMAKHENLLTIKNIIHNEIDNEVFVISKYDESMVALQDMIKKQKIEQSNINLIISGVAKALACMHISGFVHRCVRSNNVIIYKGFPKLTGFYMSREISAQSEITQDVESITERIWLPKERIQGSEYTTSCDVYSFGIMIMELYIGEPLIDIESVKNKTVDEMREFLIKMFKEKCKDAKHIQLVDECTNINPTRRLRTCIPVVNALESITF